MLNIQRNIFIENIIKETQILTNKSISKIPYKDNISITKNDEVSLIFFDIDRVKNLNFLKKDLIAQNDYSKSTILILISKNKFKLNRFEKNLDKLDLNKIVIVNIFKIGILKPIDIKREKIFYSYLTIETQTIIAKIIKNILSLIYNQDVRLLLLDLDDTCWNGVIGEDGVNKIFLDEYQKKSLKYINQLVIKTGLLVSFHSKNNEKIAIKGINKKLSKYKSLVSKSFKYINWDPKISSVKKITRLVNFSKKNIVFLDDNISEIKQINKFLLDQNCFWLKKSYFFYLYIKSLYISNSNKIVNKNRFIDIKSNIKRDESKSNSGLINYIKTSNLKVEFTFKNINFKRCEEMSNKTNQFNSNYKRYNLKKLKELFKSNNNSIVTFSVSDKYSNSGIISLMVIQHKKLFHIINEFTISCRALGRGLETFFIKKVIEKFSIKSLQINYIKTDRNMPFINTVEKICLKRDKNNYQISIQKVKNNISKYEKFIKTKYN